MMKNGMTIKCLVWYCYEQFFGFLCNCSKGNEIWGRVVWIVFQKQAWISDLTRVI